MVVCPEQCENGHEWGPGLVLVGWVPCDCAPVRAPYPDPRAWGHQTVRSEVRGYNSTGYKPRHEPG